MNEIKTARQPTVATFRSRTRRNRVDGLGQLDQFVVQRGANFRNSHQSAQANDGQEQQIFNENGPFASARSSSANALR